MVNRELAGVFEVLGLHRQEAKSRRAGEQAEGLGERVSSLLYLFQILFSKLQRLLKFLLGTGTRSGRVVPLVGIEWGSSSQVRALVLGQLPLNCPLGSLKLGANSLRRCQAPLACDTQAVDIKKESPAAPN